MTEICTIIELRRRAVTELDLLRTEIKTKEDPLVVKIWKVSISAVFVSLYPIGEMHKTIAEKNEELRVKIYHGEKGKKLSTYSLNILRDYERFTSLFLQIRGQF